MKTEVDNAKIKTSHKCTNPRSKTQMGFWNEETQQKMQKELKVTTKKIPYLADFTYKKLQNELAKRLNVSISTSTTQEKPFESNCHNCNVRRRQRIEKKLKEKT